jgi:hypothetical protein
MNSLLASTETPGATSADSSVAPSTFGDCAQAPVTGVSAVRQAEDELDEVIRELQTLAGLAQDRRDIETAKDLSRRMLAAIASRTPEHQVRLEREAQARVDADACYFSAVGELARARGLD